MDLVVSKDINYLFCIFISKLISYYSLPDKRPQQMGGKDHLCGRERGSQLLLYQDQPVCRQNGWCFYLSIIGKGFQLTTMAFTWVDHRGSV